MRERKVGLEITLYIIRVSNSKEGKEGYHERDRLESE